MSSNRTHGGARAGQPSAWRPAPGLSFSERAAEQDLAAGGREMRLVRLPNGRSARASIELKEFTRTPGRTWAYLRYTVAGKTVAVYVGKVTAPSRAEALARAWSLARTKGLLDAS